MKQTNKHKFHTTVDNLVCNIFHPNNVATSMSWYLCTKPKVITFDYMLPRPTKSLSLFSWGLIFYFSSHFTTFSFHSWLQMSAFDNATISSTWVLITLRNKIEQDDRSPLNKHDNDADNNNVFIWKIFIFCAYHCSTPWISLII